MMSQQPLEELEPDEVDTEELEKTSTKGKVKRPDQFSRQRRSWKPTYIGGVIGLVCLMAALARGRGQGAASPAT